MLATSTNERFAQLDASLCQGIVEKGAFPLSCFETFGTGKWRVISTARPYLAGMPHGLPIATSRVRIA